MTTARALLADALGLPENDLPAEARIGSLEQWDSLAHARILLALEEHIGKMLDTEEAAGIESLSDIATTLERHR